MTEHTRNGADLLCETLLANGVDHCFANPGTSEMHFVAALDRQPAMKCVLGLFEGVVTGAADGYARMADKPACTLLHTGPGLANGLANLHNARRAGTPMVNVVGDHATHHLAFDAPLTSDIEGLARPMSHWIGRSSSADALGTLAQQAVLTSMQGADGVPGRIATLILAADHAWGSTLAPVPVALPAAAPRAPTVQAIALAASALKQHVSDASGTVIMLGGKALRDEGLALASQIAAATGARLLAPQANARVQRGLGRVMIDRVPYVVDAALQRLAGVRRLVLVGAKAPVGFFGYPGKPSSMLPPDCEVICAAQPDEDLIAALHALAAQPAGQGLGLFEQLAVAQLAAEQDVGGSVRPALAADLQVEPQAGFGQQQVLRQTAGPDGEVGAGCGSSHGSADATKHRVYPSLLPRASTSTRDLSRTRRAVRGVFRRGLQPGVRAARSSICRTRTHSSCAEYCGLAHWRTRHRCSASSKRLPHCSRGLPEVLAACCVAGSAAGAASAGRPLPPGRGLGAGASCCGAGFCAVGSGRRGKVGGGVSRLAVCVAGAGAGLALAAALAAAMQIGRAHV